jgi:hypothetical protein
MGRPRLIAVLALGVALLAASGARAARCKGDDDCPGAKLCIKRKCVKPTSRKVPRCKFDKECSGERLCVDGRCAKPPEPECTFDNECSGNLLCKKGECVEPPPAGCTHDRECKGIRICRQGKCVTPGSPAPQPIPLPPPKPPSSPGSGAPVPAAPEPKPAAPEPKPAAPEPKPAPPAPEPAPPADAPSAPPPAVETADDVAEGDAAATDAPPSESEAPGAETAAGIEDEALPEEPGADPAPSPGVADQQAAAAPPAGFQVSDGEGASASGAPTHSGPPRRDFWYWGGTLTGDLAIPVGDDRFAFQPGYEEFTVAGGFGMDLAFDISHYVQAAVLFRIAFGGLDADLYETAFREDLGLDLGDLSANIFQGGLRLRGFFGHFGGLGPFVVAELFGTSMGVSKEVPTGEEICGDGDSSGVCVDEKETVFSFSYKATTIGVGAGLRYDVERDNIGSDETVFDMVSFYLQATYAFNVWREIVMEVMGEEVGTFEEGNGVSIDDLNLGHVWITLGIGYMF